VEINGLQRFTVAAAAVGDTAAHSAGSISVCVNASNMQLAIQKCAALLLDKQESLHTSAEQTETILILSDLSHGTNCLPSCILCWAVPLLTHLDVLSKRCWQGLWDRAATRQTSCSWGQRAFPTHTLQ